MAAPLTRSVSYPSDAKKDAEEIWKAFNNLIDKEDRLINALNPVEADPPTQTHRPTQVESPNSIQAYFVQELLNQRSLKKESIEIADKSYADELISKNSILEAQVAKLKGDVNFFKTQANKVNADYSKLLDTGQVVRDKK